MTFMPFISFHRVARVLDPQRRFKQVVEARQILTACRDPTSSWRRHPAVQMWLGYEECLQHYINVVLEECLQHGVKTTMVADPVGDSWTKPPWIRSRHVRMSHRAALVRKNPFYYSDKFNVDPAYSSWGYVWPSDLERSKWLDLDSMPMEDVCRPISERQRSIHHCSMVLKSGPRRGEPCHGAIYDPEKVYCGRHQN